jgi:citrate synthase
MAQLRHPGNCSATSSRTVPSETVSWLACISTAAASLGSAFGCNQVSAISGPPLLWGWPPGR